MIDWAGIAHLVANVGFSVSVPTESFLIILTIFYIKKIYKHYKYLIVALSTCRMMFASFELIIYPNLHLKDGGFIFFSLIRSTSISTKVMKVLLATYAGLHTANIAILNLQFIYRYWAVFKMSDVNRYRNWKICLWFFYPISILLLYNIVLHSFATPDAFFINYMREEMKTYYHTNIDYVSCFGMVVYEPIFHSGKLIDEKIRWWNISTVLCFCPVLITQYVTMLYCGIKLYSRMRTKMVSISPSLERFHKQMFKTLVLQITAPTLWLFIPTLTEGFLPFFDISISVPAGIVLCGLSLYPALDIFIMVYLVSDYRKAVFKLLEKVGLLKRKKSQQEHTDTRMNTIRTHEH